jgi:hypothetical protein
MAVSSSSYSPLTYNGNGATTAFSVTWPFFTGSLVVTAIASTGVETTQTITTHYTVAGGTDANGLPATGTVTMLTAPASGTTLRIARSTTKTQALALTNNDPFPAKSIEAAFDKAILITQEGANGSADEITGDVMTLDSSGATDYWDAESHKIRNITDGTDATDAATKGQLDAAVLGELSTPLSLANGGTAATTAAGARTSLGLGTMAVQDAATVAITGGSIAGITDLAVADGGTGAGTAAAARTNLSAAASGANTDITSVTLGNTGLKVADTNASHYLQFLPGSDLTADRALTFTTGDAARTITLSGNPTLSDWFDQSVKVAASPTFAAITATSSIKSSSATAGVGYATGAGGTVTQGTSKSTGVEVNKTCGQITTHNASLNSGSEVSFTVTNSAVAATDCVVACIASGATADAYNLQVDAVGAGSFRLALSNLTAGALGEAIVINFAVIKAVTS